MSLMVLISSVAPEAGVIDWLTILAATSNVTYSPHLSSLIEEIGRLVAVPFQLFRLGVVSSVILVTLYEPGNGADAELTVP